MTYTIQCEKNATPACVTVLHIAQICVQQNLFYVVGYTHFKIIYLLFSLIIGKLTLILKTYNEFC